jgi:citrate lyase subunit beta/citryl-CoA lyase
MPDGSPRRAASAARFLSSSGRGEHTEARRRAALFAPARMGAARAKTPLSILYAREIAAVSLDVETRLDCLVMGTRDLAKAARTKVTAGREPMRLWLMQCIAAARAYGLEVLDAVYNEISDLEG